VLQLKTVALPVFGAVVCVDVSVESFIPMHYCLMPCYLTWFTNQRRAFDDINHQISNILAICDPTDENESHIGKLHCWENSKI